MSPADEERAHRLGERMGEWAWNATLGGARSSIVAVLLAAVWHALQPGMAFGAWAVVFAAVAIIAWSCKLAARALRRTWTAVRSAGRVAGSPRRAEISGVERRSRVLPTL